MFEENLPTIIDNINTHFIYVGNFPFYHFDCLGLVDTFNMDIDRKARLYIQKVFQQLVGELRRKDM